MKNGQKLVFTDSPLRTQQNQERVTTSWLGIRIMCHVLLHDSDLVRITKRFIIGLCCYMIQIWFVLLRDLSLVCVVT
jgi:hypothetical protein